MSPENSIIPEKSCTFWCWVKTSNVTKKDNNSHGVALRILWGNNYFSSVYRGDWIEGPTGTTSGWVLISTTVVAPQNAKRVQGGTTYYFALWTCDESNRCSSISNIASTYAKPTSLLVVPAPILISPENGSSITTNKPTLYWNPVYLDNTAVTYSLQLDEDPSFTSPINEDNINTTTFVPPFELLTGVTYYWRLKAINNTTGQQSNWSETWSFYILPDEIHIPSPITNTKLFPPAPNIIILTKDKELNIRLKYQLAEKSEVELKIYSIAGELITTIAEKIIEDPGKYEKIWNGKDYNGTTVPTGIYIVYLKANSIIRSTKFIVIQ